MARQALSVIVLVLLAGVATAANMNLATGVELAESLLARGEARAAVDQLKPLVAADPDDGRLARLLAAAYLADHNRFWAERTLTTKLLRSPDDWETRSWLAWVQLSEGDLDLARLTLQHSPAPDGDPLRLRRLLLLAMVERAAGDDAAIAAALDDATRGTAIYFEDRALWRHLWSQEPGWMAPLVMATDIEVGHTSNATAGSPTDPDEQGEPSALGQVRLLARGVLPRSHGMRPMLELSLRGSGVADEAASELNYLDASVRPGVVIGRRWPVSLLLRSERMYLNREPSRYFDAVRFEAELMLARATAFAGVGRRWYSDQRRTRDEIDGGFGTELRLLPGAASLLAAAFRSYNADHPAYDQRGATVLAESTMAVGSRLSLRLGLSLSFDDYPRSGGYGGLEVFGSMEQRQDLLARATVELWRPLAGWQLGAQYRFSHRDSTIDSELGPRYDYSEHRVMILLGWRGEHDPRMPREHRDEGRLRLDYGLDAAGQPEAAERIRELLEQEEEVLRGCGCTEG